MADWMGQFGVYTFVVIFAIQFSTSMLPIPDAVLTSIAMLFFGPYLGGLVIFAAMFSAGTMHYLIAKKFGKKYILDKFPEIQKLSIKVSGENEIINMTYLRMFNVLTFDIVSYVAGISEMKYWKFFVSFLLGILPHYISSAFITQGIVSDGSPLSFIPGVSIFVIIFIIANWPKRSKIKLESN
jgi:uncharacterized membrane protein YdjX (TVP38/TMEM64 family)